MDERDTEPRVGSRTLNPRSPSCWAPLVAIVLVVGLCWYAFTLVVAQTGEWAIQAARHGLESSGLVEAERAPFDAQVERLAAALESGDSTTPEVVNGVAMLLDTAMVPLLVLDDLRTRRLPASGIDGDERTAADETLARVARLVDGGAMEQGPLIEILGPLTTVPEDGSEVALDDAELRALVTRANERIEAMEAERAEESTQLKYRKGPGLPNEAEITPTSARLLIRFRDHVDATLAGEAPKVRR